MILTRKSHNCAGTAFVQGDSAGGSKLIEQTLMLSFRNILRNFLKNHTGVRRNLEEILEVETFLKCP